MREFRCIFLPVSSVKLTDFQLAFSRELEAPDIEAKPIRVGSRNIE